MRGSNRAFSGPAARLTYARTRDYHDRHLKLTFDINAQDYSATGDVRHNIVPFHDLATVVMDCGANLTVQGCTINGERAEFSHPGESIVITPPAPLKSGKEAVVEIKYEMPGAGRFGGANGYGGFHWVKPESSDPSRKVEFWTQGETDGNHHWVPLFDYPNDKCTSETITTVPEDWIVIGNGREGPVSHDARRHTRTYRWIMTQPHSTYLLSLAGGEMDVKKAYWSGVPLYYVVPKGKADLIDGSFGNTPDMLQFFSGILNYKYPWPKYAQDAMYDFGGGMENVSATTLGQFSLTDLRAGHYTMSSLNSHELAHQWFGDLVTCKDWGDIWLNESFATFFEMLYMEHLDGEGAYDRERDGNLRAYVSESRSYKRPLSTHRYADKNALFDRHTYPKGGLILHMLRRELGDAELFRGLHRYLEVNAYQPVDAHDLSKAIEDATGHNVDGFFEQWIYKPGHPVLEGSWSWDNTGKAVVVHIKQVQDQSDGTPLYTAPLAIGVIRAGASTPFERTMFTLSEADQEFRLPMSASPDAVLIDPGHDLLKELKFQWRDSELPAVLQYAPNVVDRRDAANKLSSGTMSDATIRLFQDVIAGEKDDEQAAMMLGTLGNVRREDLRGPFLAQAKLSQPNRKAAALTALGKLPKTAETIRVVRAAAMSDTEEYRVVSAAIRALGALDAAGNLEVFRHQISQPSVRDTLANAVVNALATEKPNGCAPILLEAIKPPHSSFLRETAVEALASVAVNDGTVNAALVGLLKQDDKDLQRAAARALRDRKATSAIPELQALAASTKDDGVRDVVKECVETLQKNR
jgi:aminopeptidase N